MKNAFKAYDVRGVFNHELLPEDVLRIGMCYADLIKQKASIGCDVRTSSKLIKNSFIAGFLSAGYEITDIGTVPTPVSNYYALNHKIESVTVTGSHTPSNYNGIKFFDKLGIVYNDRLKKIEEKYLKNDFKRAEWDEIGTLSTDNNAINEYLENIKSKIKLKRKLKIVLDHGNGTSGLVAPQLFNDLGCEVINISMECDGTFPNRLPEPKEDNISFLQKRVIESKADFGCAFDGDADRSVFVDNKGRFLDGSVMSCLFAEKILKKNKNAYIVASVDTSSALKKIVNDNNGNLVWCAVGMKNVAQELIQNKAMFGGEVSSHFYFNDFYPFSDGILSCAKLAEILAESKESLSEKVDKLPKYPIYHTKFSAKNHEEKLKIFEEIKKEVSKEYELNLADGVKFFTNDTDWVLIRPSNTEPLIRMTVESSSKEKLEENTIKFTKLVKKFL